MKKIIIIVGVLLLGILIANPVFASLNQSKTLDAVDRRIEIAVDLLQEQIDDLNQKNRDLESKINAKVNVTPTITQPQVSPNDAGQTQRIDTLEKKVGIVETAVNGLRSAIDKTLNLLNQLLKLL